MRSRAPNPKAGRRGAAMVLVMTVLALLLILAVSFTFLMSQQEGTSAAWLGSEQTRIIARTGADHAYARLGEVNRLNQYARWYESIPTDLAPEDDPHFDWIGEQTIDLLRDFEGLDGQPPLYPGLRDADGRPLFRVEDPRRQVLGVTVRDETGKVNLNFANVATIANLIGATTVQGDVRPEGDLYERVTLEDASFLDPYDHSDGRLRSGGFVVIDHMLFSYESRRDNVLFDVVRNPTYRPLGAGNAIFAHVPERMRLSSGMFVTTPTTYKIALYKLLRARGGTPGWFNHVGDVRRIADLPTLFPPNVMRAPDIMGQRLPGWPEGIDPVAYQMLEENATTIAPTARFDGGWFYPHVVTFAAMTRNRESGLYTLSVRYRRNQAVQSDYHVPMDPRRPDMGGAFQGIGADNFVRLRSHTGRVVLGWVIASYDDRLGVVTTEHHEFRHNEAWIIEVAERAAVNINTANFMTLVALFQGIGRPTDQESTAPITREQAEEIADEIMARTRGGDPELAFRSLQDVLRFLGELSQRDNPPITREQIGFFALQQRYPYANHRGVVSFPIRFDSLDAYSVDAYATRYQPAGGMIARGGIREYALVGSDAERTYRWDHLALLTAEARAPQGNILKLYPRGTERHRALGMYELPYVRYGQTERLTRDWRARPWDSRQPRVIPSMTQDTDERPETFYSNVADVVAPTGASYTAGDLEAGSFNLWYRRHWENLHTNRYVFDVAEQDFSNRMSLLWWGDRRTAYNLAPNRPALVLRVKDRTLEEAWTELRYELDESGFRHHDWYHLAATWKGTDLSHINLFLDGAGYGGEPDNRVAPRVHHTFRQPNGAWVSRTSTLQSSMSQPPPGTDALETVPIRFEDVHAFPDKGVVVIGGEAIEYNGKSGAGLLNALRGARGTSARAHPVGAKVTVFGYCSPLRAVQPALLPGLTWRPRFPELPQTTGQLAEPVSTRAFWRVARPGSENDQYLEPVMLGPDAGFSSGANRLPLADYNGLPQRGVVLVRGLAFRGYLPPGTPGSPALDRFVPNYTGNPDAAVYTAPNLMSHVRSEYIVYNGINAQGLNVVGRYEYSGGTLTLKDPAEHWHYIGEYTSDHVPEPPMDDGPNILQFYQHGAVVILLSVSLDNTNGYHEHSIVQLGDEWLFYNLRLGAGQGAAPLPGTPITEHGLFPALAYVDHGRLTQFVGWAARNLQLAPEPFAPWRGAMGTTLNAHMAGTPVIPVFGTTIMTGEEDVVTLVQGKNQLKAQHRIRTQRRLYELRNDFLGFDLQYNGIDWEELMEDEENPPSPPVWWTFGQNQHVCALYEHVEVSYPPNPMPTSIPAYRYNQSNLLKFPTGELPVELPVEWTYNGADPRTGDGAAEVSPSADFDSFEFRTFPRGDFRILSSLTTGAPGEGGDIRVNVPEMPQNFSVIKVDDELIAYRGFEVREHTVINQTTGESFTVYTYWLTDITRGVLGTPVQAHASGTPIMNMASMRMGRPESSGPASANPVRLILGGDEQRPYGFLRLEDAGRTEILGYQHLQVEVNEDTGERTGAFSTGWYHSSSWPQAIFRGAYGTAAINQSERALFFEQPVRFPDWFPGFHRGDGPAAYGTWHTRAGRAIPGAMSPEINHIQGAATFRNSVFTGMRWRLGYHPLAEPTRHRDVIKARLVVRLKQAGQPLPEWDEVPTNRPGGLFAFDFDLGGENTRDLRGTVYEQTEDFTGIPGSPGGIRADRVEWRVYFIHEPGSFERGGFKATPNFQGAEVDLIQLTRVVRHEERR